MRFGVGVGHVSAEFDVLGIDYAERGRLTDEYLRVMASLLSEVQTSFRGRTIAFDEVRTLIRPIQSPHPPFLIGGTSKRAIRRAVEIGDGWLPAHLEPSKLASGIELLQELAEKHGSEPPGVSVMLTWGLLGSTDEAPPESRRRFRTVKETARLIDEYAQLGCERLAIDLPNPNLEVLLRQMELLARAIDESGVHG